MISTLISRIGATGLGERRIADGLQRLRERLDLPLAIELWNGRRFEPAGGCAVNLRLNHPRALGYLLRPSLDTMATAYIESEIDFEGSAEAIIEIVARLAEHGARGRPLRRRPRHANHTRRSDSDSIAYHYDMPDDFYRTWLDQEMVYSCAYFKHENDTLEAAQLAKLDHILRKIRLAPGERLLDIGCGWGALVLRAARVYGARALGITLSRNQYEEAQRRIAEARLGDRCEVRLQDYRELSGEFDKITSIGMFEHVGLRNLGAYFAKIHALLASRGIALNHGITSNDPDSLETPHGGGRFIDRYVFPSGELAHISLVLREMAAAGLEVMDVENLRRHYALTMRHWLRRYEAAAEALRAMVGERRYRIWRAYLAGCGYAFEHDWISVHQILASRTGACSLPLTRDYIYANSA